MILKEIDTPPIVRVGHPKSAGPGLFEAKGGPPLPVQFEEPKKNIPKPFVQVEHDQANVDDAEAGVGQLGHDARLGAFAFGIAKLPFDGNAVQREKWERS